MKLLADILANATVTWILASINAALFIAAMCGADMSALTLAADPAAATHRPWSVISYMFVQTIPGHFAINIIGLMIAGAWFERQLGGRRLAVTYLTGGIAGAAVFMAAGAVAGAKSATLAGSSAAVLAVYTAVALTYRRHMKQANHGVLNKWAPALPLYLISTYSLIGLFGNNPGGNLTHLAGIAAGIAAGLYITRQRKPGACDRAIIEKFERSGYSGLSADERRRLFPKR